MVECFQGGPQQAAAVGGGGNGGAPARAAGHAAHYNRGDLHAEALRQPDFAAALRVGPLRIREGAREIERSSLLRLICGPVYMYKLLVQFVSRGQCAVRCISILLRCTVFVPTG